MKVVVFLRVGEVSRTPEDGTMSRHTDGVGQWFPIGYIGGYDGIDPASMRVLYADLGLGKVTEYGIVPMVDRPGYGACFVIGGVFVESLAAARALSGFEPLWDETFSGYWFLPQEVPEDLVFDVGVARCRFKGDGLPEYRDGVFMHSMIPLGRLGWQVFFEDDPLHWYCVEAYAGYVPGSDVGPEIAKAVREWRLAHPV